MEFFQEFFLGIVQEFFKKFLKKIFSAHPKELLQGYPQKMQFQERFFHTGLVIHPGILWEIPQEFSFEIQNSFWNSFSNNCWICFFLSCTRYYSIFSDHLKHFLDILLENCQEMLLKVLPGFSPEVLPGISFWPFYRNSFRNVSVDASGIPPKIISAIAGHFSRFFFSRISFIITRR